MGVGLLTSIFCLRVSVCLNDSVAGNSFVEQEVRCAIVVDQIWYCCYFARPALINVGLSFYSLSDFA